MAEYTTKVINTNDIAADVAAFNSTVTSIGKMTMSTAGARGRGPAGVYALSESAADC